MTGTNVDVLVDELDHPVGAAYDHGRGVLDAGREDGQIYAVGPERRTFSEIARLRARACGR